MSVLCCVTLALCTCFLLAECVCVCVCVTHCGLVGPLHSDSILGPLDVRCRLSPAGHTGQVVRIPSHEQELRGSLDHRVLRGDWRTDTQKHLFMLLP